MAESCLLYYITDRTSFFGDEQARRRSLLDKIAEAATHGVDYIQLREKDLSGRELERLARDAMDIVIQIRMKNKNLKTALLINSRADVALAVGADGVHLRASDLSPEELRYAWRGKCGASTIPGRSGIREISPKDVLIAVSCHTLQDVARAEATDASFAVFAPVFEKKDTSSGITPAGLKALREACRAKIPVFALGGVTLENAKSCLEAGAAGIAGIRIFQENNISSLVRGLRR
jgi:thiamine-phosphate pyrophosphorylase